MSTLLKIDVSPRGDYSVSRHLGAAFLEGWLAKNPGGAVVTRDLSQTPLPFVGLPWIAGAYTTPDQHTPEAAAAIKVSNELVDELLAADEILIDTPMYNFAIPAALKAWVDHIVRINRTFNSSYQGLITGKKATIIIASGSSYDPGAHAESMNFFSPYIKFILGFIGITDVTIHLAGGTSAVMTGKTTLEAFAAPHEAALKA